MTSSGDSERPESFRPGFWQRQFLGPPTAQQIAFDVVFGVVGPVLCFIFDADIETRIRIRD